MYDPPTLKLEAPGRPSLLGSRHTRCSIFSSRETTQNCTKGARHMWTPLPLYIDWGEPNKEDVGTVCIQTCSKDVQGWPNPGGPRRLPHPAGNLLQPFRARGQGVPRVAGTPAQHLGPLSLPGQRLHQPQPLPFLEGRGEVERMQKAWCKATHGVECG